jgi:hypothetical protein
MVYCTANLCLLNAIPIHILTIISTIIIKYKTVKRLYTSIIISPMKLKITFKG